MTPNMTNMVSAIKLCSEMVRLIEVFETGTVNAAPGLDLTLSPTQITQLKQFFASKRTDTIAYLNAIVG